VHSISTAASQNQYKKLIASLMFGQLEVYLQEKEMVAARGIKKDKRK